MIRIRREGPREPSPGFQRKLREYNRTYGSPEIAVVWNPTSVDLGYGNWDPRWEIWVEVTDNTKQKRVDKSESDMEFGDKTWRFLNTWKYGDDSFCPLDDRVFTAARMCDTWRHPETYHELVVAPEEHREEQSRKQVRDTAYGARSQWDGYTKTSVSAVTRGDWRVKLWR